MPRRPPSGFLDAGDDLDLQVQIHTDTLNESGFYEDTMAAIGGRPIHTYHAGGCRWRARARHHAGGRRTVLSAVLDQPDKPVHAQHF